MIVAVCLGAEDGVWSTDRLLITVGSRRGGGGDHHSHTHPHGHRFPLYRPSDGPLSALNTGIVIVRSVPPALGSNVPGA